MTMTITRRLEQKYQEIFHVGKDALSAREEHIDHYLQVPDSDHRMGLTLLVTLEGEVIDHFKGVHGALQPIEPYQYYYPASDIHITIMDMVGAKEGFKFDRNLIRQYQEIFEQVIPTIPQFKVHFKGVTTSNGAVIAKGYYDPALYQLRESVRYMARKRNIFMEERYESFTAHSTIVRFKDKMRKHGEFLESIRKMDTVDLGSMVVKDIEFVYHDWYNIDYKKVVLSKYQLRSTN